MKIVTHSGMFHADDIFAVATALLVFPDAEVIRTRDPKIIDKADMVIDVGMEYNPTVYRFDHHQEGGAGIRPNGVPYASFGLVWKEFGERLAHEGKDVIEEKLVQPVDAPDNGTSIYNPVFDGVEPYTIREFFYSYLSYEDRSEEHIYEVFMQVVGVAKDLLEREITKAEERVASMKEVRTILNNTSDKRIIVLDKDLAWEPVLAPVPEAMFVVYPRKEGNWGTKGVPKKVFGFERKKLFPFAWAGKSGKELQEISGVKDAAFCHLGRFIVTANSKEGAVALAEKALSA
jgi:uncharacterized UPF0160 family protein